LGLLPVGSDVMRLLPLPLVLPVSEYINDEPNDSITNYAFTHTHLGTKYMLITGKVIYITGSCTFFTFMLLFFWQYARIFSSL
jgi:hypothetical protein